MAGLIFLVALAIGISFFFWYAARAAFKADSREREHIEQRFRDIIEHFKNGTGE